MQSDDKPKRGYIRKAVKKAVMEQFEKSGRICGFCNQVVAPTEKTQLDHIIPVTQDGTDDASNLRYIHASCNRDKWKYTDGEYEEMIEEGGIAFMITPSSRSRSSSSLKLTKYRSSPPTYGDIYWDEGVPDYRPREFTEPLQFAIKGHDMFLHRRFYGLQEGTMYHISCSCGWTSDRRHLEVDARACSILHEREVLQKQNGHPVVKYRDHAIVTRKFTTLSFMGMDDERWIGWCPCGWSMVTLTEDKLDHAGDEHWESLLSDPEMYADYLAVLKEEGISEDQ